MNLAAIRSRVGRMVAVPSPDGNFYSDMAQAVADRADLLEALDARPDLSQGDLMALRLILDDAIEEARHRLTLPDYSDEDKEWMRVRLAGAERLMDRLNAL